MVGNPAPIKIQVTAIIINDMNKVRSCKSKSASGNQAINGRVASPKLTATSVTIKPSRNPRPVVFTTPTTIPMAEHLIDSIRAEKDIDKEKLEYMNEVDEMIKEMRVFYESALIGKSKGKEDTDYEIPKFLREGTDAKDLRKKAEEIPKQELPKIKKDIA